MWARRRILEQNFASHKVEMSVFKRGYPFISETRRPFWLQGWLGGILVGSVRTFNHFTSCILARS